MTNFTILDQAANYVFSRLDEVDNHLDALPHPVRTFLTVYLAQTVIEVGGLEYFFTSDFPENPPYRQFINAYREIGAMGTVAALEKSLSFFAFDSPETQPDLRREFIESLPDDASHAFSKLSNQLREDESAWDRLGEYAQQHKAVFRLP
ncbi:MAG: DUF4375 domain-containing protein [Gammaproteobacteria bacterium]|nr:DUF4375 domain-containing protein [Gammaproteobacteria bacterium]